jgi:hypothetical protein
MQHCVGCDVGISACVGMFPWILCSHAALCWLGCRHQHSWCWHVLIDLLLQCSDCQREPPLTVLLYTSSHRGQHRMGAGYCDIPSLTWSALVLPFLVRLLLQCSDWTFSDSSNAHLQPSSRKSCLATLASSRAGTPQGRGQKLPGHPFFAVNGAEISILGNTNKIGFSCLLKCQQGSGLQPKITPSNIIADLLYQPVEWCLSC